MRMPASTGSAPVQVTDLYSKRNPSTGEPSGASALGRSIPALRSGGRTDPGRLAPQQVDDVVVDVAVEHDPDRDDIAGIANGVALEAHGRVRKVEQRRERLR